MDIDIIQKEIETWNKWSYDFVKKEFVFFSWISIGELADPDKVVVCYKPKYWVKGNLSLFWKACTKENLKNFAFSTSVFCKKEIVNELVL